MFEMKDKRLLGSSDRGRLTSSADNDKNCVDPSWASGARSSPVPVNAPRPNCALGA